MRRKSSRDELISVSGNFLAVIYMALRWNEQTLGRIDIPRWKIQWKQSLPGRKDQKN